MGVKIILRVEIEDMDLDAIEAMNRYRGAGAGSQPATGRSALGQPRMADEAARPTKRQRLTQEFEHHAEGRRTLETFSCSICSEPFDDPVSLRDSGHTYCRACITRALAVRPRCPLSNTPIDVLPGTRMLVPNHQVRTLIDSQRVACRYAARGCAARPELGAVDAHEASCAHAPTKCARCPFVASRAETEAHERSCPYVVLAPVLDAQESRIRTLKKRADYASRVLERMHRTLHQTWDEQMRINEKLAARLDALESGARAVTPASARRPPNFRSAQDMMDDDPTLDLAFDAEKSTTSLMLSSDGKVAFCDIGCECAISSSILQSGTHSWEICLTRTDGEVAIGVCTERHGFCLELTDDVWCCAEIISEWGFTDKGNQVASADAPWNGDVEDGSILVVTFDCGTGRLSVGLKGKPGTVSHVFNELASTPVAPFVFLTSCNTCEITALSPLADPAPVFQYPHGAAAVDGIVVTRGDLARLEPDEFLNDNLVDFYFKVIVADARRSPLGRDPAFGDVAGDVHAFSSHFFTKLREGDGRGKFKPGSEKAQRAHARVERWTRNVDVFAKKFLLVPVVEDLHWSLAVVCHPGELAKRAIARERRESDDGAIDVDEDEDENCPARPCIIHMDSLRMHSSKKIEKWLRCFLEMEWRKRKPDEPPFTLRERSTKAGAPPADLLLAMPKVPQQTNSCDCGVFTLRYGQEFLARAVSGGAPALAVNGRDVSQTFGDHNFEKWFKGRDITNMRRDIKRLAEDLEREEKERELVAIKDAYRDQAAAGAAAEDAAPPVGAGAPLLPRV